MVAFFCPPPFMLSGKLPSYQLVHAEVAAPSSTSTFTVSSVPLGQADPTRVIVAIIACRSAAARTFTSITIGGVQCNIDVAAQNVVGYSTAVARLAIPTGATSNIAVTLNGSLTRWGMAVYALYDLSDENPVDTDLATGAAIGATQSLDVDTPAGGIALFGAGTFNVNPMSWAGATKDYDQTPGTVFRFSAASLQASSSQNPLTATLTPGGTGEAFAMAAASYR